MKTLSAAAEEGEKMAAECAEMKSEMKKIKAENAEVSLIHEPTESGSTVP